MRYIDTKLKLLNLLQGYQEISDRENREKEFYFFQSGKYRGCLLEMLEILYYRFSMLGWFSPLRFLCSSAPASPTHMGLNGSCTPDSLSRESSPIPEGCHTNGNGIVEMQFSPQAFQPPPSLQKVVHVSSDFRYSQSAPGSPSGKQRCIYT